MISQADQALPSARFVAAQARRAAAFYAVYERECGERGDEPTMLPAELVEMHERRLNELNRQALDEEHRRQQAVLRRRIAAVDRVLNLPLLLFDRVMADVVDAPLDGRPSPATPAFAGAPNEPPPPPGSEDGNLYVPFLKEFRDTHGRYPTRQEAHDALGLSYARIGALFRIHHPNDIRRGGRPSRK